MNIFHLRDASMASTRTLPNANATNYSSSIDLGAVLPQDICISMQIEVQIPALTDHTNTSITNTFTLQDSADNVTFANVNPLIQFGLTGVATTGTAATAGVLPIPANVRRYARVACNVPTSGGTGSNATCTIQPITR